MKRISILIAILAAMPLAASAAPRLDLQTAQPEVFAFTRASSAYGPGTADASTGSELVVPTLLVPQGAKLTFVNLAVAGHSIYSEQWIEEDELRLFNSEVVPFRFSSEVRGVPNLKPGTYPFFCSNHMGMKGRLTIVPTSIRSHSR